MTGQKTKMKTPADTEIILHLSNKAKVPITLRLRRSRPGEEKALIACIRDEYGDTYFKRSFYQPEYLRREAASGHITFFAAENLDGEIAGMMILKDFYPEESMCEIASQIFKKKYRGYGLSMPFFEYGMRVLQSRDYSAAYCLPVLFHDITQRRLYHFGLRATGMILHVFDVDKIRHSYDNGRNRKHSQGIQSMALTKRDAGVLYVPKEHKAFIENIYGRLHVKYSIHTEEANVLFPMNGDMRYSYDAQQSSMEIRILSIGTETVERIKLLQASYPLKGKVTYNIFLNINDSNAIKAYHIFHDMGYFFTGLKCLCSDKEYMVLHHPGEVPVYLEDYVLSSEFAMLGAYVSKCYAKRYENTGKEEP